MFYRDITHELKLAINIPFWAWHNGAKATSPPFIWYHEFLSFEEAMAEYKWLTDNLSVGWQDNWIPYISLTKMSVTGIGSWLAVYRY